MNLIEEYNSIIKPELEKGPCYCRIAKFNKIYDNISDDFKHLMQIGTEGVFVPTDLKGAFEFGNNYTISAEYLVLTRRLF